MLLIYISMYYPYPPCSSLVLDIFFMYFAVFMRGSIAQIPVCRAHTSYERGFRNGCIHR